MKKLIITSALITVASMSAFAQNAKQAGTTINAQPNNEKKVTQVQQMSTEERMQKGAENQARSFERQYGLTADQYKNVYAACLEFVKSYESARTSGTQLTSEGFKQLIAKRDAKLKSVMSPAQFSRYETTLSKSVPQAAPAKAMNK